MKVILKTDPELSFLHAMAVIAQGAPCIDSRIERGLRGGAAVITERLELAELEPHQFWHWIVAGGDSKEGPRVDRALLAAGCSELGIDSLAPAILGRLADARLAYREIFPKLADQLPLRARPLWELWEAVGPGLLRQIARRTIEAWIPPKTTLHVIQPARGGDGGLIEGRDEVWIEGVLTHPNPRVAETLRIAWLLARKGYTRSQASRPSDNEDLSAAATLALIPIVLAAGEELGICETDDRTLGVACETWHVAEHEGALRRWWHQMQQSSLPLPIAIKALQRMLQE